ARAVLADDADALSAAHDQIEVAHEPPASEIDRHVLELEDRLAEARRLRRERRARLDLRRQRALRGLRALDARLLLAGARLGLPPQPFELAAQEVLPVLLDARLEGEPVRLRLEVVLVASV